MAPAELGGAGPFSDAALAALLLACLGEDLAPALAGSPAGRGARDSPESCSAFVVRTAALLEAERGAEIAEAEAALADGAGLHRGMVQGRLLRGLMCAAVSSPGFLGGVVFPNSIEKMLFSFGGDEIPAPRFALFTRIPKVRIRSLHPITSLPHEFPCNS